MFRNMGTATVLGVVLYWYVVRMFSLVLPGLNPGMQGILGMSRYTEGCPHTRVWIPAGDLHEMSGDPYHTA